MTAYQKTFIKCVVVLSVIALISGLLLGLISQITHITDEEKQQRALKKIEEISPNTEYEAIDFSSATQKEGVQFVFESQNGYAIVVVGKGGYKGDIQIYFIISDGKISDIVVGTNSETPGVSDAALKSEKFMSQFKNKTFEDLKYLIDDGGVEMATGATYSSTGSTDAVKKLTNFYLNFLEVTNE